MKQPYVPTKEEREDGFRKAEEAIKANLAQPPVVRTGRFDIDDPDGDPVIVHKIGGQYATFTEAKTHLMSHYRWQLDRVRKMRARDCDKE